MSTIPEIDELVKTVLRAREDVLDDMYNEGDHYGDFSMDEIVDLITEKMSEYLENGEMPRNLPQRSHTAMKDVEIKSIKHETSKAWLVILSNNEEVWFPKSQCTYQNNIIRVPQWLYKDKIITGWDE